MPVELHFDIPALIIFVGIVLGALLSIFFIKKAIAHNKSNLFMGVLLLVFSLNMLEGWLNYTGLIFKALHLTNFSEPTNFIMAPLLYLFVSRQLVEQKSKWEWLHYVPFIFWLGYCMFFFMQSADFKYNSNVFALRLDIEPLTINYDLVDDNPLGIRDYVNELTILHILIYSIFLIRKVWLKSKSLGDSIVNPRNSTLRSLRNAIYHFLGLLILLIIVKTIFQEDVGDYILYIYLSFLFLLNMIQVMNTSMYFEQPSTFLEFPSLKYQKSSLTETNLENILNKVRLQMENEQFYKSNLASLSQLAKNIHETSHHVSQAINDGMNMSFFEVLATYRIEEAKHILASEGGKKFTIQEVAEQVGYNSKSAFNTAFKKLTSQTPSEFRKHN